MASNNSKSPQPQDTSRLELLYDTFERMGWLPPWEPRLKPPVDSLEIAYHLILLGQDCGLKMPQIARWLARLDGFPMWPSPYELARLMAECEP